MTDVKNSVSEETVIHSVEYEKGIEQVIFAAKEVLSKDENSFVDPNGIPYQQLTIFDV